MNARRLAKQILYFELARAGIIDHWTLGEICGIPMGEPPSWAASITHRLQAERLIGIGVSATTTTFIGSLVGFLFRAGVAVLLWNWIAKSFELVQFTYWQVAAILMLWNIVFGRFFAETKNKRAKGGESA